MDTEKKRESNVRLNPETFVAIKEDAKANSLEIQLEDCNTKIAVLEKDKVHNKELLEQFYAERKKILNQIKAQESM